MPTYAPTEQQHAEWRHQRRFAGSAGVLCRTSTADHNALNKASYSNLPSQNRNRRQTPFPCTGAAWQTALADELAENAMACSAAPAPGRRNTALGGQFTTLRTPAISSPPGWATTPAGCALARPASFGYLNPDRSVTPVEFCRRHRKSTSGAPVDNQELGRRTAPGACSPPTRWPGRALASHPVGRWNQTCLSVRDPSPGRRPARWTATIAGHWQRQPVELSCAQRQPDRLAGLQPGQPRPAWWSWAAPQSCRLPNASGQRPGLAWVVSHTRKPACAANSHRICAVAAGRFLRRQPRYFVCRVAPERFRLFQNVDRTRPGASGWA